MKSIIKLIAVMLCVVIGALSFAACEKTDVTPSSSETQSGDLASSDTNSKENEMNVTKPESVMFDNDLNTFWKPSNIESDSIEFSFDEEKTFNSISFVEQDDIVTDAFVEIKKDGEWVEIFHSDELGTRTAILDKTYTAKDVRLTISMMEESGGICELSFEEKGKIEGTENFRTLGYYTASRIEWARETNFDELKGVTDLILFDYGSWDKNGNFIWSETYNEEFLQKTLKELEEILDGRKVNLWFCLQNYHKASTTDTKELFATEASIKKLTKFSIDICKKYGFAGVDIDYEYPMGEVAWSNFDKFLNYAAKELHKNDLKLTAAMIAGMNTTISAETASLMDYVNIMAYDLQGKDTKRMRASAFKACQDSFDYFTNLGFKPEQMMLGLPYHMRFYDGTKSMGDAGYKKAINRWRGGLKGWMNSASIPTGTYSFNGPEMIKDKTYFAMANGMSGVFNWCVGSDIPHTDPRSLSLSVMNTIERFSK